MDDSGLEFFIVLKDTEIVDPNLPLVKLLRKSNGVLNGPGKVWENLGEASRPLSCLKLAFCKHNDFSFLHT